MTDTPGELRDGRQLVRGTEAHAAIWKRLLQTFQGILSVAECPHSIHDPSLLSSQQWVFDEPAFRLANTMLLGHGCPDSGLVGYLPLNGSQTVGRQLVSDRRERNTFVRQSFDHRSHGLTLAHGRRALAVHNDLVSRPVTIVDPIAVSRLGRRNLSVVFRWDEQFDIAVPVGPWWWHVAFPGRWMIADGLGDGTDLRVGDQQRLPVVEVV